ncbi:PREDICTED: peroxisomal sarcosine oxidase-like [Priapulus caudatus]|uniref:Peroxisomal sarcosine oxidase-like n=1 Tax=Priapulus caudatus TaxID=37621 RepID=A0ABM1E828_PRICU|nr:PREDICTED: peroxisomal sarcosine oxidase-like [Priapulus caudatus]
MEGNYDCIVVGAGIEGSGAAFQLARMGVSTVLLEQFPLPHSRGSSSGPSRIIRRAYTHKFYAEMMDEAYDWWHRIAAETDTALYKKCGMLTISDDDHEIQGTKKHGGFKHAVRDTYTAIEDNYKGVYDPDAGTLMADKCLRCLQCADGASERVPYWREKRPGDLPLQPVSCDVRLPTISSGNYLLVIYQADEYPRSRSELGRHIGNVVDPDNRDEAAQHIIPAQLAVLTDYVSKYIPGLDAADGPAILETCMYTVTPDEVCIIDRHPQHPNVIFAAGFSGTGFKLAPVLGKVLAEMVLGCKTSYDTTPFSMRRFQAKSRL